MQATFLIRTINITYVILKSDFKYNNIRSASLLEQADIAAVGGHNDNKNKHLAAPPQNRIEY